MKPLTLHSLVVVVAVLAFGACGRTYVAEEVPATFEMPAGVTMAVDLIDPARVADIEVGENFAGALAEPLYYPREKLDPQGNTYEEETLVAPIGAPVAGVAVAIPGGELGLQLKSVTFHGGMSFPVETAVLIPPVESDAAESETDTAEELASDQVESLTFTLAEPADVAMVIDYRDNEER